MAFETLGIGGVLTFSDTQAVRAMGRTSKAFQGLQMRAQKLSAGMAKVGAGVRSIGLMSMGAAVGLGLGLKSAISFENQMASVASVTRSTSKELKLNADFARKLGIETAYSATEAGKAMYVLGKFGLQGEKLRKATKGVTDLAAAVGVNMESASTVMIGSLKAMSMSVDEAKRASDVLSLAAASTEADVIGLGESFAYAGSTLKQMNVSYEMSAAAFGLLAGKMMKGSRAGTGMMALMRGLQGSSGKSAKLMKALGINIQQFGGDMSKLPAIIAHVKDVLDKKFTNPIKKAKAVTEIFGRFGQVAFFNLAQAGKKQFQKLADSFKNAGAAFKDKFGKPMGAAAWMAKKRLDSVQGAMTLFKSSMEGLFISIFKSFLGPLKTRIQTITAGFNGVLKAMQMLEGDASLKNQTAAAKKYGAATVQAALGIRDGLQMVRDVWKSVGNAIKWVGRQFGQSMGKGALRQVLKIVIGVTMLLGTMAPLFLGLLGIKMVLGAVISIASGLFTVLSAVALPVIAIVAGVAAAFVLLRQEGESVGETVTRIFTNVAAFARNVYQNAILPIFYGVRDTVLGLTVGMKAFWSETIGTMRRYIRELGDEFMMTSDRMVGGVKPAVNAIKSAILKLRPFFKAYIRFQLTILGVAIKIGKAMMKLGRTVGSILKSVLTLLKPIIGDLIGIFGSIFAWLYKIIGGILKSIAAVGTLLIGIWTKVLAVMKPIFSFLGKYWAILYRIGRVIIDFILIPFRAWYAVISRVVGLVANKLAPVFRGIGGILSTVFRTILAIGKAIGSAILVPFKFVAGYMAKALGRLASVASYIPGLSKSNILKLQAALQGFSGTGMIVNAGPMGAVRRRRAPRIAVQQTSRAEHLRQAKATQRMIDYRAKKAREQRLQESIEKRTSVKVSTTTSIDGRCVADATARHRVEIQERAGYGMTPWQRRAVILRSNETTPQGSR